VLGLLLAMAPGVRADSVSYSFTRIATTDGPSVFFSFSITEQRRSSGL